MSALEIEGTEEEQMGIMKSAIKQCYGALFGNGQSGVIDYVAQQRGMMKLIVFLLTLLSLLVAILGFLEGNRQIKSGELKIGSNYTVNASTKTTLDAKNPYWQEKQ